MEISIFDVLGPVMIGPSSSHTAGAARLARVAAQIAGGAVARVEFGLSGSFAKTGLGHGTNKALVAGVLGLAPDDELIRDAGLLAQKQGLEVRFYEEDLNTMHENSVHFTFYLRDGGKSEVWGSSLGGGRILITRIDDYETRFHADNPTIILNHLDRPGVISEASAVLAKNGINIAVLRLSREAKGRRASATFVLDDEVPAAVAEELAGLNHVEGVRVIHVS